jgi:nitrogenase molybdenum-iron protein beta chain
MDGSLFVVLTSCVTEIIGDDVQAVVSQFRNGRAVPGTELIFARTGGFKGNSYYGYDIVMSAIAKQFVAKAPAKKKRAVNVLGIVPYMDSFWRGNLGGIRATLELLDLEVNTYFTEDDTLDAVRSCGGAELNIVVSDLYGLEAAETYREIHGIPYISASLPVGPTAAAKLLRETAQALKLDVDIEGIIEERKRRYFRQLEPLIDCYHDADLQRYAVVIGDVNYAVGVTRFITDDLGWIPELVQFTEILNEEQQKALTEKLSGGRETIKPQIVFDTNSSEAGRYISARYPRRETDLYVETLSPAFVIGSSLDRELALTLGAPHLSVSFPVSNRAVINRGYTGFDGGLTLTEDLLSAVVAGR